ncbi:MAG: hypothetical protein AB9900_03180 [Humidesulfovibrio sp.]
METSSMDKRVWTRVSGDGKSAAAGMSLGSGGGSGSGTKTGAGGKPQPYGWHGYYGETGGGSSSGPEYRGRVTLPHEARGKVTPPVQKGKVVTPPPPAPLSKGGRVGVSTKNDDSTKPDPKPEALNSEAREQVQSVLDKSPKANDVNMNSAYRSGDPTAHGEGQAADINRINGQKVSDAVAPNVPEAQREAMRRQLREMRAAAETNPEVEAYIDPLGGFFRPKDRNSKEEGREANVKEIYDHRHHIHITIRKVLQTRQ